MRNGRVRTGEFGSGSTAVVSLQDAKELGQKLAAEQGPNKQGATGGAGGAGVDLPGVCKSPSPSRRRPVEDIGTPDSGASPLAYLRSRPGRGVKAKSKTRGAAKASPKKMAGGGAGRGAAAKAKAGAKRKSDGGLSKQEELRLEAEGYYTDLIGGIDAVKTRWQQ